MKYDVELQIYIKYMLLYPPLRIYITFLNPFATPKNVYPGFYTLYKYISFVNTCETTTNNNLGS